MYLFSANLAVKDLVCRHIKSNKSVVGNLLNKMGSFKNNTTFVFSAPSIESLTVTYFGIMLHLPSKYSQNCIFTLLTF